MSTREDPAKGAMRRETPWWRRLLRGERGAVFAEAVIMLPFFILVWSLVVYTHDVYGRKIALSARIKGCTWQYSNSGCRDLPPGCPSPRLGNVIEVGSLGGTGAGDLVAFASLPIVSGILRLILGTDARVMGTVDVPKPVAVGSGSLSVRSVHIVMCNEVPKTAGEVARGAFCTLTSLCR